MSRFNMLNEEEKRAWLEGLRGRVAARGDSNQTLVDRLLEGKPGDAVRVLDLLADSEAGKRPSAIRRSSATKSNPKSALENRERKKG